MKLNIFALLSVLALAACETADGFGQDVEAGGEAISDVSNDVQQSL
ncbi:MAG: entericidin A/B family lipoprotein [Pseudomonadota bacterium]